MQPYRESLGYRLTVATTVLKQRTKKVLAHKGLNLSEYTILRILGDRDGMSLFEIARLSRWSAPQLTLGVKTLEKRGLVRREVSGSDKRVNHLFLTEAGRETLMELEEIREQLVGNLGLSPEEIETLCNLAGKMIEAHDRL